MAEICFLFYLKFLGQCYLNFVFRKNHGKLECLLKQMDLLDYQKLFVEQEIDNKTLFTLSDNDLKQLGIEDEMERAKIVDKLNTYND
ncbi:ankyrin repeat and SAM domain-containing protein 6-like [Diaphorina citri]|uniref:Ankyrin repeat and SAM domain-containing protein 6-like n=1 Tax=Diaphorina citri TaxID=121845 RepID=A0A3Q0J6U6_DIACI|nr:ankyrin repeat and SAM domain-containing protein 6-like [Diaphorina citri]